MTNVKLRISTWYNATYGKNDFVERKKDKEEGAA